MTTRSIGENVEKITIKDIAREAGVSVATVSYIINGINEERYTKETKQKVLQVINLYNYRPSKLAQSLANNKSSNVILLCDRHTSVLQKAENFDLTRMLGKALERQGYNLLIRTHLDAIRIDIADAIVCAGMEEKRFRRLAVENYVPMLTVDAKINDELFFQVYQDFESLMRAGTRVFGADNFSVVLVDTYNETLKADIRRICKNAIFLGENSLDAVPSGNIVTVNTSLSELSELGDRSFFVAPAQTERRIEALLGCLHNATERVAVTTHTVLVE